MEDLNYSKAPGKVQQVFRCKYCGRNFMSADELIAHKKENHMAEIIAARKLGSATAKSNSIDGSTTARINSNVAATVILSASSAGTEVSDMKNDLMKTETGVTKSVVKDVEVGSKDVENGEDVAPSKFNTPTTTMATSIDPINETLGPSPSVLKASNEGFQCPVCNATFHYDYQLMQHMTSHSSAVKPIDPPLSSTAGVANNDIQPERIKMHKPFQKKTPRSRRVVNIVKRYRCKDCGKRFQRSSNLVTHMQKSHKEQATCPPAVGSKSPRVEITPISTSAPATAAPRLTSIKVIRGKRGSYPGANTKSFKCKHCNFSCRFKSSLLRHQYQHGGFSQLYKCEFCSGSFKSLLGKSVHIRTTHPAEAKVGRRKHKVIPVKELEHSEPDDESSNDCKHCGKTFQTPTDLQSHRKLAHGKSLHKCDYCPYVSMIGNVKVHMARLHQNKHGTEHQCQFCGGTCHSPGSLLQHIRLVHKSETAKLNIPTIPISDSDSRKKGIMKSNAAKVRRETRKRSKCSECPYTAFNFFDVNRHMKNIHTVQRLYQCEFCSGSYEVLRHLEKHKLLHSSEAGKNKKKSSGPIGWRNTRKSNLDEDMPELEPMVDTPREIQDDSWNSKTTVPVRGRHCRICEVNFISVADHRRHCRSQLHIYNEKLRQMQRRGEKGKPSGIGHIRFKTECNHCGMLFQTRMKLFAHMGKKHGGEVVSESEGEFVPPSSKAKTKPSSSRLNLQRSGRVPEDREHQESPGESEDDSVADSELKSEDEQIEESNEIKGEDNRTVTVTQQSNFGLKITTVRYGN